MARPEREPDLLLAGVRRLEPRRDALLRAAGSALLALVALSAATTGALAQGQPPRGLDLVREVAFDLPADLAPEDRRRTLAELSHSLEEAEPGEGAERGLD